LKDCGLSQYLISGLTFTGHTQVDGALDIFVNVLGDRSTHARSAIGVGSLPCDFSVEIEAVVEQL